MSIRLQSAIWESGAFEGRRLLILLALADFASDEGHCWPSVPSLAKKARASDRWVQLTLREFESEGILERMEDGGGRHKTNHYLLSIEGLKDAHFTVSPNTVKRVNSETERVKSDARKGEVSVHPTRHRSVKEPSLAAAAHARCFVIFEDTFNRGVSSEREADAVEGAYEDFGAECFEHCMTAAALEGATSFAYPLQIMRRHKREGCDDTPTAQPRANGRGSQRAVKRRGPHDWFEEREGESETDAIERAVRESYRNQSRLLPGDTGYEADKHVQDVRPEKVT